MDVYNLAFEWTDTNRHWLIEVPIRIVAYLVVALIARYLLHRMIDRATTGRARKGRSADVQVESKKPPLLRYLRDRASASANNKAAERRQQRAQTIGSVLKSTVSILLLIWVVLAVLSVLGVNIAPFIASAGVVGLAIGFGAQNLVRDFVSGVFMLLEDQYGVGDTVDLGSASGTVVAVSLRTTTLRAGDGTIWHVRNGEVLRVGNSSQGQAVVTIPITVPYDSDTDRAATIALEQATAVAQTPQFESSVLVEPTLLGITDVAPGTVTLGLQATVVTGDKDAYIRAVRSAIRRSFEQARKDDPTADFRPPLLAGEPAPGSPRP